MGAGATAIHGSAVLWSRVELVDSGFVSAAAATRGGAARVVHRCCGQAVVDIDGGLHDFEGDDRKAVRGRHIYVCAARGGPGRGDAESGAAVACEAAAHRAARRECAFARDCDWGVAVWAGCSRAWCGHCRAREAAERELEAGGNR